MKKLFFQSIIFVFGLVFLLGSPARSDEESIFEVTTENLIERPHIYDGRQVVLRGEVIGDIMPRGYFAWINLKDQYNSVGVWVPLEWTRDIMYRGNYRHKGDLVEVYGIFKRADADFGGEFCIRAQELKIIQPGYLTPHQLSDLKVMLAWSMLGIMFFFLILRMVIPMREKSEGRKL